ncbi:MAG: TMEM165/GDT1 family protein [Acidiferrobacterales bacterium]
MHPFLVATGLVTLAEMGDKTQLLAIMLAARFRRPTPVILGILGATVLSNGFATGIGEALAHVLAPAILNWVVLLSFVAMGIWVMVPEKMREDELSQRSATSVFLTVLMSFLLAEMGDKTQILTVALAARFQDWLPVAAGTTLGMMLANVPAIVFGHRFADRLPVRWIRLITVALFLVLGGLALHRALQG